MRPTENHLRPPSPRTPESGPDYSGRSFLVGVADSVFRNWLWILGLWVLATFAAGAYWMRVPRGYESEMTFLVRNDRADVSDAQMSTEAQMLMSRDLTEKLLPVAGFVGATGSQREAALVELQGELQVSPVAKSNMIRVSYRNPDAKRARQVLETLAAAYIEAHSQLHRNSGSLEFLERQSTEAEKRWKEAQQKLLDFEQSAGVVSGSEEKDLLLRRQIELQTALHQAEAELKDTARRIDSIRPRLQALAPRVETQTRRVPNQYSVERLSTMLAELQNRRTELLSKYRPTERVVTQLDQQIADTTKAFQEASSRVSTEEASDINPLRQSLETELGRTEGNEAGLRGRIQSLRAQDNAYHDQLVKLDRLLPREQQLQREVKVAEENYLLYAKRREEARIGQRMDEQKTANVVLSEKPRVPVAQKSRLGAILALYALALAVSVLLIAMLARMRRTVQTPWDLKGIAGVPVLGTVPEHKLQVLPQRMRGFS